MTELWNFLCDQIFFSISNKNFKVPQFPQFWIPDCLLLHETYNYVFFRGGFIKTPKTQLKIKEWRVGNPSLATYRIGLRDLLNRQPNPSIITISQHKSWQKSWNSRQISKPSLLCLDFPPLLSFKNWWLSLTSLKKN